MTAPTSTLDDATVDIVQQANKTPPTDSHSNDNQPLLNGAIPAQFIKLALPIIIALLVNGLYSFVDAIFITRGVGVEAMASVSAVFPIYMIIISISAMLGSGMASIISRALGNKNNDYAIDVFSASLFFAVIVGIVCSIVMLFFQQDLYQLLSLPQTLLKDATDYLTPILIVTVFSFISGTLTECFRASGKAQDMMKVLLFSSFINIILDALFILGFGWGVAGASWATVLAIMSSLVVAIHLQLSDSSKVTFSLEKFRFNWTIHKQVLALGVPILLSHSGFAFSLAVTIYVITQYSSEASLLISAHGLLIRSFMLLFLPLLGMMIALQTLAGYNYGAGQYSRVKQSLYTAIGFSSGWAVIVTLILVIKPHWLLQLFTDDQALINAASDISSIVFLGFVFSGISMMCSGLFQAMGKALPAILLDSIRTYIILLPAIFYLPSQFGVNGIWWAFPLADYSGVIITVLFTTWYLRHKFPSSSSLKTP